MVLLQLKEKKKSNEYICEVFICRSEFYLYSIIMNRVFWVNIIFKTINYFKELALLTLSYVSFVFPKPNVT